jgi:tRNA(Ile)-lysidine synthase
MPARFERHGMAYHRPLLGVPGQAIRAWLAAQGIDAGSTTPATPTRRYTRNRIRHGLLPALAQAFPQFRETFARSAAMRRRRRRCWTSWPRWTCRPPASRPPSPRCSAQPRRARPTLLRHWLRSVRTARRPSAAQLDELLDQLQACTTRGHRIRIKVGTGFVERAGQRLDWYNPV